MALRETIEQGIIRFFFHPFSKDKPIDFKTSLKEASQILIACSPGPQMDEYNVIIDEFIQLFPDKNVTLLLLHSKTKSTENSGRQKLLGNVIHVTDIQKMRLWHFRRSQSLKQLKGKRFEVLIDLDPEFNLLNIYLCRVVQPTIRIAFTKPYSDRFYNVQYNGKPDTPFDKNIEGLLNFLRSLIS